MIEKGNTDTDNLIKSRFAFGERQKKKSALFALSGKCKLFKFANRRLAGGQLEIDFKKPWSFLAKLPAVARAKGEGEVATLSNSEWWCLLDKVRTFFENHPD